MKLFNDPKTLSELLARNGTQYVTRVQFNNLRELTRQNIQKIESEKKELISDQKTPVNLRIQQLKSKDSELETLRDQLRDLEKRQVPCIQTHQVSLSN
jgi:hypothetical protein